MKAEQNISPITLVLGLGLIGALVYIGNTLNHHPESSLEPQALVDYFIDSGIDLPEPEIEIEFLTLRKIIITTDINAQSSRNLIRKLHILNNEDPQANIDLYMRTEGGYEADAFSIIDTIQSISAPVSIHAIGEVHSSGAMILTSGTGKRVVYENTLLGFHALELDEGQLWEDRYITFWKKYSKIPEEWIQKKDGEMIYFSAEDAITYGIADAFQKK